MDNKPQNDDSEYGWVDGKYVPPSPEQIANLPITVSRVFDIFDGWIGSVTRIAENDKDQPITKIAENYPGEEARVIYEAGDDLSRRAGKFIVKVLHGIKQSIAMKIETDMMDQKRKG